MALNKRDANDAKSNEPPRTELFQGCRYLLQCLSYVFSINTHHDPVVET